MYTMFFVTSNRTLVLLTPIRCITLYLVLTLHLTSLSRVPSKRVIAVNGSRAHAGLYVVVSICYGSNVCMYTPIPIIAPH